MLLQPLILNFSGKMRSCVCMTSWCTFARSKHLFGARTVILSSDSNEKEIWTNHLEIVGDDFTHILTLLDPRVWVGHFHYQDYIVIGDDEGNASFNGIDFKSITKFREYDTGRSSLTSPARPAATKNSVVLSYLGDCRRLSFPEFCLQNAAVDSPRRRKRNAKVPEIFTTPPSSAVVGRGFSVPFFEFFVGMSENIISLMRSTNSHGQACKGSLIFRRCEVTTRRLTLTVRCMCSLGKSCQFWPSGVFKWQSTSDMKISTTRTVPVTDVLYALGVCMTPNTMAHSDQLFTSMMLTPPSRNLLKEIIRLVVDPYLIGEKARLIKEACRSIRDADSSPILCMDVGHSSARKSQAATLAAACGNVLLFTLTDTATNAWLKETALVERALDFAINTEKLDVYIVEIDDNTKNASLITSYSRVKNSATICFVAFIQTNI